MISPSIDDGNKRFQPGPASRHARSADSAIACRRGDARLWDRAAASASIGRCPAGRRKLALSGATAAAVERMGESGVGSVREEPARTVLLVDARGPPAA